MPDPKTDGEQRDRVAAGRVGPVELTDELRAEYTDDYDNTIIRTLREEELDRVCSIILGVKDRYLNVGTPLGVPWWWIGAIHNRECSLAFSKHLHNGDLLLARTVNVPAGRPVNGKPPFTWEQSADDALHMKHMEQWDDWTVAGALFAAERYNGWGYRYRNLPSPYIWAGTNHYTSGKFVDDHKFDPQAVDKQLGVAAVIKQLDSRGLIEDWY